MNIRIVEGPQAGQDIAQTSESLTFGRGHDNTVVLSGEGISRHHFRIAKVGDEWRIKDLGSVNGVTVNGSRIEGPLTLHEGDEIQVCGHRFVVADEGGAGAAAAPLTVEEEPSAEPPSSPATPLWDDDADHPKGRFPWGRAALLLVLVGLIAALATMLLTPFGDPGTAEAVGNDQAGVPEADAEAREPPREISDNELAALIAEEEQTGGATPAADPPDPALPPGVVTVHEEGPRGARPAGVRADPESTRVTEAGRAVVTDVVYVASDPSGATVVIDGETRGTTPLLVQNLSQGRHRIVLTKEGYEDSERHIHVPDLLPSDPYPLRQRPGTLHVRSTVPGTAVWRGPQLLGVAPTLLSGLEPGEHDLAFVAPGCEAIRKTVNITQLRGEQVDVAPVRLLGTLEIVTLPAGCEVTIDGGLKAVTRPEKDDAPLSAPLRFEHLRPGSYTVNIAHPAGVQSSGVLPVKPGETVRKTVKLWVPDTRLLMIDGDSRIGMLVDRNEQGDIVLAETPRKLERYLKPEISRIVRLSVEDIRTYLESRNSPEGARHAPASRSREASGVKPAERPDAGGGNSEPRQGDSRRPDAERTPPRTEGAEIQGAGLLASELNRMIDTLTALDIERRLKGRSLTIRGVPSASGRDDVAGYIAFGRRIRCRLSPDLHEDRKHALRQARDNHAEMTVTGSVAGMRGDTLVLSNCIFRTGADGR